MFPTPDLPEGCCELVKLYLLKAGRGKGLGKALIQECFKREILILNLNEKPIDLILKNFKNQDINGLDQIKKAWIFANEAHVGQYRKSGERMEAAIAYAEKKANRQKQEAA